MKPNILEATRQHRITAILRGIQPECIKPVVQALFDGGIRLLEVTFNQKSPSRLEDTAGAIQWAKEAFGEELYVGAGTVMSQQEVLAAKQAGAEFILAPNVDEQIIRLAVEQGMCAIPGAMTPTEIARAYAAGAEIIKLFPAGNLGLGYCKAVGPAESHSHDCRGRCGPAESVLLFKSGLHRRGHRLQPDGPGADSKRRLCRIEGAGGGIRKRGAGVGRIHYI